MKTTIKELSEKLKIDTVYINGFIRTLVELGKASIVGVVERPEKSKGKAAKIYEINDEVINTIITDEN